MSTTPWITAGDCKSAATGLAGLIFSVWTGDADAQLTPPPANVGPFAAALATLGSATRKKIGSMTNALASAVAGIASFGTGLMTSGSSSITISDSAVTSRSKVIPFVTQTPDTAALCFGAVAGTGSVSIYANASVASGGGLNVAYISINL